MTARAIHVLVNALSVSSGGGFTVCRELVRGMAAARPVWKLTVVMTEGSAFHEPMRRENLGANTSFLWAPAKTGKIFSRVWYENFELVRWAQAHGVHAVVQLNGQKIARMKLPTISHAQDPVPYLPRMWTPGKSMESARLLSVPGWKAKFGAMLRRRAVRSALRDADCMGFTSAYLRDLICGWEKITPKRSEVLYNAVPEDWCARADAQMPGLHERALEVVTVSDVTPHKRQLMVARSVLALRKEKGLENLTYRVVGRVFDESYADALRAVNAEEAVNMDAPTATTVRPPVVQLVGRLSGDELAAAFKRARCFAFLSVCESFGIPPLEAMSFGTPVVSSDCCAMPEVLGDAAAYVRMDDQEELTRVLRKVLTDESAAEAMRAKGFERFRKFRWAETVEKMVRVLDGV
ncbi:MAG: glycosyltransferase [Phycisphaerales bacterium]